MREAMHDRYINACLFWGKIANSTLIKGVSHNLHPARFAHPHELKSLLHARGETAGSLLLGIGAYGRPLRVTSTPERPELGNLAVIGRTRCGKGLLAKSQLLTWPHSVIVNDIKGDLFADTAGYRSLFSNVYVFDTRGVGNTFDPLQSRVTEDELLAIAGYLLIEPHEGDGTIFTKRAVKMLAQLFKAARFEGQSPLPYAAFFIHMGLDAAAERLEAVSQKAHLAPDENLATRFLDARIENADYDSRFLQDCFSTLDKLEPLMTKRVLKSISSSDFTAEDIMCGKKPVTVYLRWPEMQIRALSPLVRLVWSCLFDDLITLFDERRGEGCRPVLALLDEAGRAPVANLPELSSTVVGRNITLWTAYQSRSQPEAIYGVKRADELWDNINSIIYYRPAIANHKSAAQMQEALGFKSAFAKSQTTNAEHETSAGESEQQIPLLVAWEIQRMKDNQIIGGHADLPYFRGLRMDYRNYPVLKKRSQIAPPLVPPLPETVQIPAFEDAGDTPDFLDPDGRVLADARAAEEEKRSTA